MKVCLYARVSSDKQDVDLSITAQLKALREYAERNGHQVVMEFVDEAESGRSTNRPQFKKMITMAKRPDKPFEQVLVWKYSRFSRIRHDSILFKTMLKKNGVQVVSINEPSDDSSTGKLLEAIIESLDEFYSENLGEEVTRGMRESASRGFYLSAKAPYGYKKVKVQDGGKERTKLEIEDSQLMIVKSVFNEVLKGKGLGEIVRDLNQRGIKGPTDKGWAKTGLHTILTNEVCTGTLVWGRNSKRGFDPVRVENACPAIIDKDVFDKVQKIMNSRAPVKIHPKRVASRFLLSGIAFCGHCGKALIGRGAKSGKFTYYVCGTLDKKGAGSCKSNYLNAEKFDRLIIDKIKSYILTTEHVTEMVQLVNEDIDQSMQSYYDEIDGIEKEICDINHRLKKLYDAIETGDIEPRELAPRIHEHRMRQEQLMGREAEIQALISDRRVIITSEKVVAQRVEELHELLNNSSLTGRRAFVKGFVNDVTVTDDEVTLSYSLPLAPDGSTKENVGVLPTVQYGGRYWI